MYTFIFLILIYLEISETKILTNKLNVLVILADDGGFEMGTYRNKICQTPNLDQLAKNSLIFNKAFTSVSSCSPSRAALLTGMPSHQNGIYGLHQGVHHFDSFKNVRSISKILKENKIRTGIIGKKHVGPESVYPFDFSETEENNSILQVGRNITHIKLLTRQFLNTSEPFFLYIGFHDPHRCGHTNPKYGEFCQRFGNGEPGMGLIPDWQPIIYQPDELELPYFIPNTWEARKDVAAQYTTISRLDQGVGLIIDELKKSGHYNNTLIIYSSDNGIPFPSGRTNFYDSGIAEPLFISSPIHKERKGQVTNSLSSLLDIVPTILDWYGIENYDVRKPNNKAVGTGILTGKSLLPLLEKEPADKSKEIVFGSHNLHEITMYYPMRMARSQRYKLIHNLNYYAPFPIDQDLYVSPTFQDILNKTKTNQNPFWYKSLRQYYKRPEWELYDLKYDPEELNNIVKKNSSQAIFNELQNKIYQWQKQTKDPWICSPHAVFENVGRFKNNPECLDLDNVW